MQNLTHVWSGYASPEQLIRVSRSFERFAGTSLIEIAYYSRSNEAYEAEDVRVVRDLMSSSGVGDVSQLFNAKDLAAQAREVLNGTHAIAAIQPWALEPVLPAHLKSAISSILSPFYKPKEFTIRVLQRELQKIANETFRPEGGTGAELSQLMSNFVGDKDRFFGDGGHSFGTSIYHEAMSMVFRHNNIELEEVRLLLAAAVGSKLLWPGSSLIWPAVGSRLPWLREGGAENGAFQASLRQYLERCYLQRRSVKTSGNVPSWALDIYAIIFWVGSQFPSPRTRI